MARIGRGLICLTLMRGCAGQLRLPLMVSETDAQPAADFTIQASALVWPKLCYTNQDHANRQPACHCIVAGRFSTQNGRLLI